MYDRLLVSYCRLSVYLSVTLCIVAKRYVVHQQYLNKSIGSAHLRTQRYNFQPPTLTLSPSSKSPPQHFERSMKKNAYVMLRDTCRSRDIVYTLFLAPKISNAVRLVITATDMHFLLILQKPNNFEICS